MRPIIAVVTWVLSAESTFAEEALIGCASVIHGDTIEIAGERIRLYGIDAPESWQICDDGDGLGYREPDPLVVNMSGVIDTSGSLGSASAPTALRSIDGWSRTVTP